MIYSLQAKIQVQNFVAHYIYLQNLTTKQRNVTLAITLNSTALPHPTFTLPQCLILWLLAAVNLWHLPSTDRGGKGWGVLRVLEASWEEVKKPKGQLRDKAASTRKVRASFQDLRFQNFRSNVPSPQEWHEWPLRAARSPPGRVRSGPELSRPVGVLSPGAQS